MVKTIKIWIVFFGLGSFGEAQGPEKQHTVSPLVKSFVVPGWGQHDLHEPRRGNKFLMLEAGLIFSYFASRKISDIQKNNYIAFAVEHAQISKAGKDHNYWVDIGNFNTLEEYNSEHLRNREIDALYSTSSTWNWEWDSSVNRANFENSRINSDHWRQRATFIVGGLVLNHIISVIDVVYLRRLQVAKMTQTEIGWELGSRGYGICLYF